VSDLKAIVKASIDAGCRHRLSARVLEVAALAVARVAGERPISPGVVHRVVVGLADPEAPPRERVARLRTGERISVDIRDLASSVMYFQRSYEPHVERVFSELVRPGSVVIDGGANAGVYTCRAARLVGRGGEVHAFEPAPLTCARLERSVALNHFDCKVFINALALTETSGHKLPLFVGRSPGDHGLASLRADHVWGRFTESVDVETVALDDYVERHGITNISVLKLDIEGAEGLALQGARHVLSEVRPGAIVAELIADGITPPEAVIDYLGEFGYQGSLIDSHRGLVSLSEYNGRYGNVLFRQA
jgi:FkbM family methyltransferase